MAWNNHEVKDYPPYLDYPKERKKQRRERAMDKLKPCPFCGKPCPFCGKPVSMEQEGE